MVRFRGMMNLIGFSTLALLLLSTVVLSFATVRFEKDSFQLDKRKSALRADRTNDMFVEAIKSRRVRAASIKSVAKSTIAAAGGAGAVANGGDMVAKILGYMMGAGSLLLYSPIILKLLNTKKADGFSHETWMFNLIGLTAAVIYPFKKGFPVSTYVEILILCVQSFGILGLLCSYKDLFGEYTVGMGIYLAVTLSLLKFNLPATALGLLQWVAILVCNYAQIPQIMLTFRTKRASWSPITAIMSMVGNTVRVFTTLQLTGDKLVLSGNLMGLVCNITLLTQCWLYRNNKEE